MNYILIKEGDHRPNSFSDLVETVNNSGSDIDMYTRVDYGLRLLTNKSNLSPEMPLALMHYHVDSSMYHQNPNMYRPIDVKLMLGALDTYDYVLLGIPNVQLKQADYTLITEAVYIGRNAQGELLNLETGECIAAGGTDPKLVVLLGMVRMQSLPIYQIILDPKLVHAMNIEDEYHAPTDSMLRYISDTDGTVRSNIFAPTFDGAVKYGDTLLASSDEIRIKFFRGVDSFLDESTVDEMFSNSTVTIESSHMVSIDGADVVVSGFTGGIGFIHVDFHCGLFYDHVSEYEKPSFRYLIVGQNGNKHS